MGLLTDALGKYANSNPWWANDARWVEQRAAHDQQLQEYQLYQQYQQQMLQSLTYGTSNGTASNSIFVAPGGPYRFAPAVAEREATLVAGAAGPLAWLDSRVNEIRAVGRAALAA